MPSHSRPHVSDDNPFSEAQFKTLKYRPDFPARFGAYEDAETFGQPERFPRGVPVPPPLPTAAWINKPPASPALVLPEGAGS